MRPKFTLIICLLALSAGAFGQASTSEVQTLQALLSEVRGLRQDLRASLSRAQSMQILLARFQIQEGAVTRATDRWNDARQKLLDAQFHQKELGLEQKRIEDSLMGADPQQQSDLLDRLSHVKSGVEAAGHVAQQQQTAEIQAEQQLREERDKLNALEGQLDELIRAAGSSTAKSTDPHP